MKRSFNERPGYGFAAGLSPVFPTYCAAICEGPYPPLAQTLSAFPEPDIHIHLCKQSWPLVKSQALC